MTSKTGIPVSRRCQATHANRRETRVKPPEAVAALLRPKLLQRYVPLKGAHLQTISGLRLQRPLRLPEPCSFPIGLKLPPSRGALPRYLSTRRLVQQRELAREDARTKQTRSPTGCARKYDSQLLAFEPSLSEVKLCYILSVH